MTDAQARQEALRLVTAARAAVGLGRLDDLPPGLMDTCQHCPIANALLDAARACGCAYIGVEPGRAEFYPEEADPLPGDAAGKAAEVTLVPIGTIEQFIRAFDAGRFPDLITRNSGPP